MPVTDAVSYELAFHVLPTVAEGEVADVFTSLAKADVAINSGNTVKNFLIIINLLLLFRVNHRFLGRIKTAQ